MRILYSFSQKGDREVNEDVCGFTKNCAWVVDGATDVFKLQTFREKYEVNWYVNELHKKLKNNFCIDNVDIHWIIKQSVKALYDELVSEYSFSSIPVYKLPTFAIAAVRINEDNTMNYYILGDCSIVYVHNHRICSLKDRRLNQFSQINRQKIKDYQKAHGISFPPNHLFQEIRGKANSPDGYPIGSIDGTGLDKGLTGTIELFPDDKVLIYSDGFEDYFISNPDIENRFLREDLLPNEIEKMYDYLKDLNEFLSNPRPRRIDDASLILLSV